MESISIARESRGTKELREIVSGTIDAITAKRCFVVTMVCDYVGKDATQIIFGPWVPYKYLSSRPAKFIRNARESHGTKELRDSKDNL